MLDITFIRKHPEEVKKNAASRGADVDVDQLLVLDKKRREYLQHIETLRAKRNKTSKRKPNDEEIKQMKKVGEEIKAYEMDLQEVDAAYNSHMRSIPNMTHPQAPIGEDETHNRVVREVGEKPVFSFEPKEHWELGKALDVLEFEKAVAVSGTRFAYLKGDLALMEFALVHFVLAIVTNEKTIKKIIQKAGLSISARPYVPIVPPVLIRPEVMQQMGRLEPREERYHIAGDDLYLVGSAEHTLGPLHMGETIDAAALPIRYIGFSTAFRREAGSYGKDTKGIFRVHQFDKLEFESFCLPEDGESEQDLLVALQEYFMHALGIPYRVVFKCTGDMGAPDYREFDIEAWLPGQGAYRETHTADYMTDYQSRRLDTKYKHAEYGKGYVHMNDATAIAIQRTLIAIMENYQQEDGSMLVPKVLVPYMGKKRIF